MGLTPTGGVVMGTRTGDLDPGVLLHLHRAGGLRRQGARATWSTTRPASSALSERTGDLRELVATARRDPRAALALAAFARSLRQHIGALAAELGGLDMLVFTGGVGEHAPTIRADACATLGHLGIQLDAVRNEAGVGVISADGSARARCGSWPRTRSW